MRTSITRDELCAFIESLGADPSRVKYIYSTPFKLTVEQYRLDENGLKVYDSEGFSVEEYYEIAIEGGRNDDRQAVEVTEYSSPEPKYI